MKLPRVCVIGNLNIDLIIRGVPEIPAWGHEVFGTGHAAAPAGQAANIAMALARLGTAVSVISAVGEDAYGGQIKSALEDRGVGLDGVVRLHGTPSAITVGVIRTDGERAFISDFTPLQGFTIDQIERQWDLIEHAGVVVLAGIFCLPGLSLQQMTALLARVQALGKPTVLDTGWDPANWSSMTVAAVRDLLKVTTIFLPNLDEARAITGSADIREGGDFLRSLGPETVVIKRGAGGSIGFDNDGVAEIRAVPVQAVDAVGAGDMFDAAFLHATLRKSPLAQCLRFANAAAAIYVSRESDRFPTEDEVRQLSTAMS